MDFTIGMTMAGTLTMLGIDLFLAYLLYYCWDRGTRLGVILTIPILVSFAWLTLGGLTADVRIKSGVLTLDIPFYGRSISLDQLELDHATIVDLDQTPRLRPQWRSNGLGTPGFQLGWFHLVDGEKALVALGPRRHALYLPTTKGYAMLMSVDDPEALLEGITMTKRGD